MFLHISNSTRKPVRFLYFTLATLALVIIASPGRAAGILRSQPAQQTITGATTGMGSANQPDATCPPDGQCFADVPPANPFYEFVNRIYQQDLASGYACGGPGEPCDANNRPYYRPGDTLTRQQMSKFIDNARRLAGIHIEVITGTIPIFAQSQSTLAIYAQTGDATALSGVSTGGDNGIGVSGAGAVGVKGTGEAGGYGVWGINNSSSGTGVYGFSQDGFGVQGNSVSTVGVFGYSETGIGVDGHSTTHEGVLGSSVSGDGVSGESESGNGAKGESGTGIGMFGTSDAGLGVFGYSNSGIGVDGHSTTHAGVTGSSISGDGVSGFSETGNGIYGQSTDGLAGSFNGDVAVTGTCCGAASGTYKIDNPADPANQYLYHSAVQSPDMMDIYNGNITTDAKGEAVVTMPSYFQALNRDFRYQLTPMGQFAQVMVLSEIRDNSFSIKTDKPNVKISWQVTGIRQDAYANAHRTPVEEDKPADERGKYLYPTELDQPVSSGVNYEKQQQIEQQATQSKP